MIAQGHKIIERCISDRIFLHFLFIDFDINNQRSQRALLFLHRV